MQTSEIKPFSRILREASTVMTVAMSLSRKGPKGSEEARLLVSHVVRNGFSAKEIRDSIMVCQTLCVVSSSIVGCMVCRALLSSRISQASESSLRKGDSVLFSRAGQIYTAVERLLLWLSHSPV